MFHSQLSNMYKLQSFKPVNQADVLRPNPAPISNTSDPTGIDKANFIIDSNCDRLINPGGTFVLFVVI